MKDYRRDLRVDDQAEADFAELQTKASIETLSIKPNAELFEKILDGRRGNREFTDSVWKEICSDFKNPKIGYKKDSTGVVMMVCMSEI